MKMRRLLLFSIFLLILLNPLVLYGQSEILETKVEEGITTSHLLYPSGKSKMEALLFKPSGDGPFPAIVMIHGHSQSCFLFKLSGNEYAKSNYVVFAPSMVGYGKSKGYSDFGGPKTLAGLLYGIEHLKSLPYVNSTKIGIYGFSRGAHAASLLITQTKDLKAAVLVGGIYEFGRHYGWASGRLPGVKKIIEDEVGVSKREWAKRSVTNYIENIECPVLIIHGEKDERVSVEQAQILADALLQKAKNYELWIVPDADHGLRGVGGIKERLLQFYGKYLY